MTVRRGGGFLYQDKLLLSQRDPPPPPPLLWVGSSAHAAAPVGPARGHRDPAGKAGLPRASASCHLQQTVDGHSRFRHKPREKKHSYLAFFIAFATQSNFCRTCQWERRGPGPARGSEWWGLSLGGLRSPPSLGGAVCWGNGPVSACLGDAFSTGRPASPSSQVGGSLCLTHAEPTASEGHVLSAGVGSGRCPERL